MQTKKLGQPDVETELKNYLKGKTPGGGAPYLGIVHRLDQPVEGILVLAKTKEAAAKLSEMAAGDVLQEKKMKKYYMATVYGFVEPKEGTLIHFLLKDGKTNSSQIVSEEFACSEKGKLAKKAKLCYRTLSKEGEKAELLIRLYTGRHHQIRVQLAGAGVPILGDTKYGSREALEYAEKNEIKSLRLRAVRLEFPHPKTGEIMKFTLPEAEDYLQEYFE